MEDQERTRIDARIAVLEAQIQDLRFERNTLSVTSKLPPELLGRVFLYHQKNNPGQHYSGVPTVYKISHVSRYWRAVALNCPQLWSTID
ncbi:hypothetical protein FA15DRAFT_596090, partial [Coprinopsis marcescibilis]